MTEQSAEGYDIPAVEAWIANQIDGLTPPLIWTRLEGGHSNLTYQLSDAQGRVAVIRRPPKGQLLPGAHDMGREWALISALGPTTVPVPPAMGFCEDPAVTGAHFYVMGRVEGRALFTASEAREWVPEDRRETLAYSFYDTMADIHNLDPDTIGLGELGKKSGYVARQLKSWYRSWTASVEPAQLDDPRAHELYEYFLANVPDQGPARVVHGDYRLQNCLVGADSRISAVLDWEISTLGDPLADLGYALLDWPVSGAASAEDPESPTAIDGLPTREQLARHYASRSGRSLDLLDYYLGFNCWKKAAILHGVYARYQAGQKSTKGINLIEMRQTILRQLESAATAVERLTSA